MNAATIDSNGRMEPQRAGQGGPQLRTILLTDLVDSTALVERLGDTAAAELFRAHDRLVLGLQQHWRGRLIDRSDGMLLLFERPIDGLGFALDYNRGLLELGAPHGVELKARAGLHVGEVLTWRNSEESVRVGAKPVEVEGLAKPMAGRLMTMARPGQILLSAVAEPLAHRAARELGERGQHLLWKSHGRWRFKGVPEAQQIFEVGEAGVAPLRTPPNSPKAWRDIPLWRRPAALAAEIVAVAVIAIGIWFITKPQPAIAFNERDWVVLADLRNLTGEPLLDDSLEQAFRISLEQSRHVNVLSDLKVQQTLQRMRRDRGGLDRAIASEVALRDGARAVILPTVAEVGGHLRISAEIIDPHSQTTVYSEYADGRGVQSSLSSIDDVTTSLREKLGEALERIEQESDPLPEVTTDSLEALRAYALGHKAFRSAQWKDALVMYEQALAIDPGFALAHLGIARVYVALSDRPSAIPHLDKAVELRDKLPQQDRMYLDAWRAELLDPAQALSRWKALASMYPDNHAGSNNAALRLYVVNDFGEAARYASAANVPQAPLRGYTLDLIGRIQLAQQELDAADVSFTAANAANPGASTRRIALLQALHDRHEDAEATLNAMQRSGYGSDDPIRNIDLTSFALDQALWRQARERVGAALEGSGKSTFLTRQFQLIQASAELVENNTLATNACMRLAEEALGELSLQPRGKALDHAYSALFSGYLAQRAGNPAVAKKVLAALQPTEGTYAGTVVEKMLAVVRAGDLRLAGRPADAVRLLSERIDGTELFQARVALRDALVDAGDHEQALVHSEWLSTHRGLAYVESNAAQVAQSINVMDTRLARLHAAESLTALGRDAAAKRQIQGFLEAWPRERLPDHLARRVDVILPASKQKTT